MNTRTARPIDTSGPPLRRGARMMSGLRAHSGRLLAHHGYSEADLPLPRAYDTDVKGAPLSKALDAAIDR
jgi:hypothetical protein